jgi:hypothetical protein
VVLRGHSIEPVGILDHRTCGGQNLKHAG